MFDSNKHSSPSRIRFEAEDPEKYESLFSNKHVGNNGFRPLNPPPFSLSQFVVETEYPAPPKTAVVSPRPLDQALPKAEDTQNDTIDAAVLLTSMKKLIEREVHASKPLLPTIPDLERHFTRIPPSDSSLSTSLSTEVPSYSFENSRARTVSMDSQHHPNEGPICISPTESPLMCPIPLEPCHDFATSSPRRTIKRLLDSTDGVSDAVEAVSVSKPRTKKIKMCKPSPSKTHVKETKKSSKTLKTILRKKFSWKNYPELENFLISNREEYLRHSALNYTMQQKQYNNHLTERLVDLASECGYVFDSKVFTFVAIRDRIRCYFKSYVQSRKKRGVIIGYAARKAGLLSEKELEKSAITKGKIFARGAKGKR
jgi:hypothetical protein